MKCEVTAFGKVLRLNLEKSEYGNGRPAVVAMEDNGEKWGMLTVNIPDTPLEPNEIIVKDYSEGATWVPQVLEKLPEVFEDTGKKAFSGHVAASIWLVKQVWWRY
jgi:hypothetical protein